MKYFNGIFPSFLIFVVYYERLRQRFIRKLPLEHPILDLGCGDGHFASVSFTNPINVGLDPWIGPIHNAAQSGSYDIVIRANGERIPYNDNSFRSVISNSVLEHIQDIDPVIKEVSRVLKSGGRFVFCVPNHQFLENLSISSYLERIRLFRFAELYRGFFNKISRHYHCDDPTTWEKRLSENGFRLEKYWHYFSPDAFHVLEWGHYFGLPSLILHFLSGKWIVVSSKWNLFFVKNITHRYFEEQIDQPDGSYTFYIAIKQ